MKARLSYAALLVSLFSFAVAGCSGGGALPGPANAPSTAATPVANGGAPGAPDANSVLAETRQWTPTCPSVSSSISFNSTPVSSGNTLWFSSVLNMSAPKTPVVIYMTNSTITYKVNGALQTMTTPNAAIVVSPQARFPFMEYDGFLNTWAEIVPAGTAGNVFLNGAELPLRQSLPGGATPVTWSASFITSNPGITFNWQWSAAAYKQLNGNLNYLGVKALDDPHYPPFNSDPAGTPEQYKGSVTAGAAGNGAPNYTGTLSSALGVTPCSAFPTPAPSASPTPPAFTALVADAGQQNGQVNLGVLQSGKITSTAISGGFQLDSIAYFPGSTNFGVIGNGASQNLIPFSLSGSTVVPQTPISVANQCVSNPPTCDATSLVMPDRNTAIVALNASGSNYLLEVSNIASSPTFSTIPIGGGSFTPEDTDSLVMSNDAKVIVSRGADVNVFEQTAPDAYSMVNQFSQFDGQDQNSTRGRQGMSLVNAGSGDYVLLLASTSAAPQQNGILALYDKVLTTTYQRTASTRIDPAQHAYAVATDGKTAFVGTDVGIALVPGVNTESFASDITGSGIVSPIAGTPGSNLVQISTLAVTPDNKWLVVMGLPSSAGATVPGGQGYLDVLPILYNGTNVTLGPAVESLPITVPNEDQLLVF